MTCSGVPGIMATRFDPNSPRKEAGIPGVTPPETTTVSLNPTLTVVVTLA
jgi:hypothetical protein